MSNSNRPVAMGSPLLRPLRPPQQKPADNCNTKNPKQDSDQPDVQPHVAVQDVAELVANDALQFVAGQNFHATSCYGNRRVAGAVSGSEGIDAVLPMQEVNLWNWNAGCDGHFLDHIEQLAFVRISCIGGDQPSAQRFSQRVAAPGQFVGFVGAADENHGEHPDGNAEEKSWVPQDELRPARRYNDGATGRH